MSSWRPQKHHPQGTRFCHIWIGRLGKHINVGSLPLLRLQQRDQTKTQNLVMIFTLRLARNVYIILALF